MNQAATLAEVARALNAAHPAGGRLPALVFVTDDARVADPVAALAQLPKGCAILFRHYDHPGRAELAARVVDAAHDQGRIAFVAGDMALARSVGADGLHLPSHLLTTQADWRRHWSGLITAAAHSADELQRAEQAGCDAALLSPVFATASHPHTEHLGNERFKALVQSTRLPVYALGGITSKTAPELLGSGAVGLAAVSGLLRA